MSEVKIYSKDNCVNCKRAKFQLKVKGIPFVEEQLTTESKNFLERDYKTTIRSVPVMVYGSKLYTFEQLTELLQNIQ